VTGPFWVTSAQPEKNKKIYSREYNRWSQLLVTARGILHADGVICTDRLYAARVIDSQLDISKMRI
jgi:hypothetical protein